MQMTDVSYFDVGNTPDAFAVVTTHEIAREVLASIDAGSALPNALADRLLNLLIPTAAEHRAAVVKDFLRPIQKRLERSPAVDRDIPPNFWNATP